MAPFMEMLKRNEVKIKPRQKLGCGLQCCMAYRIPSKYIISYNTDWKN
jgi:hypothetical protein